VHWLRADVTNLLAESLQTSVHLEIERQENLDPWHETDVPQGLSLDLRCLAAENQEFPTYYIR